MKLIPIVGGLRSNLETKLAGGVAELDRLRTQATVGVGELLEIIKNSNSTHPRTETQDVFNRKEAAEFLRLKVSTLDKYVKAGRIKVNLATRRPLFTRQALLNFVDS